MTGLIIPVFCFAFGAVAGSFLNVCISRIPQGKSVVYPPSHCPKCLSRISFYDNIPIISYALLRGRCRACLAPISSQYPFVEAISGSLAALMSYRFGITPELFIYFAFASALIVITFIDLEIQIIPDGISLNGIIAGAALSFFLPGLGILSSFIGISLGVLSLFAVAIAYHAIAGAEGMGGGDIKLLGMIGAFTGWKGVVFSLMAGSFLGAIIGIIAMLKFGKTGRHAIPFGPFLSAGALLYVFFGGEIIAWYVMRLSGA